jgi:hypothetical protein
VIRPSTGLRAGSGVEETAGGRAVVGLGVGPPKGVAVGSGPLRLIAGLAAAVGTGVGVSSESPPKTHAEASTGRATSIEASR